MSRARDITASASSAALTTEGRHPAGARGTVLLVANYAPDVGFAWWLMENFWIRCAALAAARGMDCLLLYPVDGPLPAHIRAAPIETMTLPFPGDTPAQRRTVAQLVRERNVKFIYLTDRGFTSPWYAHMRRLGVRAIVNHDHTPGDRPPSRGVRGAAKALFRRLPWLSADAQYCVSPLIRERAIATARIPPARALVVQNGIVPIRCSEDRDYARRVLGLRAARLVCVTVGRAHPYKRVDFVLEVARRYVACHGADDIVFVHCGDGPDLERLASLHAEAALGDSFVFAGRRDDVKPILCASDIAIHAAMGEAFSLAVVEYMSAGLAVLVPDIPTVRQAIDHGRSGFVYADGDADAVVRQLHALVQDDAQRARIGAAARTTVERDYAFDAMLREFDALTGRLMDERVGTAARVGRGSG